MILGKKILFLDKCFLDNYSEIFERDIYRFSSTNSSPCIIDCGSNIGLSIIYFKNLFPNSKIIGFEADPNIYNMLIKNIASFNLSDVSLYQKAVWNKNEKIKFLLEGGNSSRLAYKDGPDVIQVDGVSLRPFLEQTVDFLKIDIEGAEFEVIEDCQDLLYQVKNLFIEYHSFLDQDQKLSKLLSILTKAGFRYYLQHTGVYSKYPFVSINTMIGMDLQMNIFAYRKKFH
jgi:FkbM family methyltransferase